MTPNQDTKATRPDAIGDLGDALKNARPAKPASLSADLMALRGVVGLMNNPEISGNPGAPSANQLMEEAKREFVATQKDIAPIPPPAPPPAAPAPVVSSAGVTRFMFTGKEAAQPDSIVQRSGLRVFSLDQVVTELLVSYAGLSAIPNGLSTEFKMVGEGVVNQNYPMTLSRIAIVHELHHSGYEAFGNPGFWVKLLHDKVVAWEKDHPGAQVAVIGIRYNDDFSALKSLRFIPFHVMCSNQTAGRLTPSAPALPGDGLNQALDNYVLGEISRQRQGPTLRAIWNDSQQMPAPRFLTPETFQQNYVRLNVTAPVAAAESDVVLDVEL